MAVSHDSATLSSQFSSPSPFTFAHTPIGTPRGVIVVIGSDLTAADIINGTVSYGGEALSRVTFAGGTDAPLGAAWMYHLGTGIPTGTQTVSIAHNGSTASKVAACISVEATLDTYVSASSRTFNDRQNPTVLIDSGTTSGLGYVACYFGLNQPSNTTVISGMTIGQNMDFGSETWKWDREENPASSSRSIGYTSSAADNMAMVAAIISEVAAAASSGTGTPIRRPSRIPEVPSELSGVLGQYLRLVVRQLNSEQYLSLFSGTSPESIVTGLPGSMAVNIGSASDASRLWIKSGSTVAARKTGWVQFGGVGANSIITTKVLSSDVTVNSATPSNITGLGMSVTSGVPYYWRFNIGFTKASNLSVKMQVAHDGANVFNGQVSLPEGAASTATGYTHWAITFSADVASTTTITSTEDLFAWADGMIIPSTNGTLQPKFGNGRGTSVSSICSGSSGILIALG